MKIRVIQESVNGTSTLCPYVVCEGCDETIRSGQEAIVVRDKVRGNVEDCVYHEGVCAIDVKGGIKQWGSLKEWLSQIQTNSVGS